MPNSDAFFPLVATFFFLFSFSTSEFKTKLTEEWTATGMCVYVAVTTKQKPVRLRMHFQHVASTRNWILLCMCQPSALCVFYSSMSCVDTMVLMTNDTNTLFPLEVSILNLVAQRRPSAHAHTLSHQKSYIRCINGFFGKMCGPFVAFDPLVWLYSATHYFCARTHTNYQNEIAFWGGIRIQNMESVWNISRLWEFCIFTVICTK